MSAPLFSLNGITKSFSNGTVALSNMSMDVREGEFISLLGPSGCGKSTALRIMAGLGTATRGSVDWQEKGAHEISFVFQEPTLMPWANVFTNVWLPLRLKGISKSSARERVFEALQMVGLEKFSESYPRELSGGMKMRVSIARALITRPQLLLMDEPFAALDEITRLKLNDDLLELWSKLGWTVVFVTHSVYESVYLSSRIAVMAARPGRIVEDMKISAPYPRGEAFRTSEEYGVFARQASQALHAAMNTQDHL
ncbi:MAG: ABC transporter ATP-binding protein [Pseudomonadota bacterium]